MNDDQLTAEIKRAFGRYRATPESLDELAAEPGPGPVRSFERRTTLRLGAGVFALAACLAIAALVLQPFAPAVQTPSAFASWQRVPTSPDPAMAGWASSHCSNTPLPLLIQDQRGMASLFAFREGTDYVLCVVYTMDTPTEKDWASYSSSAALEDYGQVIEWFGLGFEAGDQSVANAMIGRATGATSVVIVRQDGVEIQASVRDGLFAAWWPTSNYYIGTPNPREIRAYGPDGSLVGDLQVPVSSETPYFIGTPPPAPSGPPASAES
jgi:hypothetical protein